MKRSIYLLLTVLFCLNSQAQNWNFIPENDTLYFGIRVEALQLSQRIPVFPYHLAVYTLASEDAHDSSGILVQNMKKTLVPQPGINPLQDTGRAFLINTNSFLGNRVEQYSDGIFKAYHPKYILTIPTQAKLQDTWLYKDGNQSDSMKLIAVYVQDFFGQSDSVKLAISNQGDSIVFSKNHGLVYFTLKDHVLSYEYLGSQKKKDHVYIPEFQNFYQIKTQVWYENILDETEASSDFGTNYIHDAIISLNSSTSEDSINWSQLVYRETGFKPMANLGTKPARSSKFKFTRNKTYYKKDYLKTLSNLGFALYLEGIHYSYFYLSSYNHTNVSLPGHFHIGSSSNLDSASAFFNVNWQFQLDTISQDSVYLHRHNNPSYDHSNIMNGTRRFAAYQGFEHWGEEYSDYHSFQNTPFPDTNHYYWLATPTIHKIELKVYPNPTKGQLKMEGASGDYLLYNSMGKMILKGKLNGTLELNLSNHPNGIYIMEIIDPFGANQRMKILKL